MTRRDSSSAPPTSFRLQRKDWPKDGSCHLASLALPWQNWTEPHWWMWWEVGRERQWRPVSSWQEGNPPLSPCSAVRCSLHWSEEEECRVTRLGQTMEKPRGQPEKTRQFFKAAPRFFHSYLDILNPVGQSGTFETLKSLKQKSIGAFRLSLRSSLEKLPSGKPKVCPDKA